MLLLMTLKGLPLTVAFSCKEIISAMVYCKPLMVVLALVKEAGGAVKTPWPPTRVKVTVGHDGEQLGFRGLPPLSNRWTVTENPGAPTWALFGTDTDMVCEKAGCAQTVMAAGANRLNQNFVLFTPFPS